ncbi:MAG: ribbon-helix-helix domain-containing protein [Acidimicrobiales bacterium]
MTTQIAVKLPDVVVNELDLLVMRGIFDSRSQAVRTGVEALLTDRRRRDVDQRYREAAARSPEGVEEQSEATRLAIESIHAEPWDRWW